MALHFAEHYTTDAEKYLKNKTPIKLKYALIKETQAKQKPSEKQMANWTKAKLVVNPKNVSVRVQNDSDEPLPVRSMVFVFDGEDKDCILTWGADETPLVTVPPKGLVMIVFKPNADYMALIERSGGEG